MTLLYLVAIIFTLIGLKYLSPILIYIILSIFFTILISPVFRFFDKKGVPTIISFFITLLGFFTIFSLIIYILNNSITEFSNNLPIYQEKFKSIIINLNIFLNKYNYKFDLSLLKSLDLVTMFKTILSKVSNLISGFLIVIIGVSFLLFESKDFAIKIRKLNLDTVEIEHFTNSVQRYFIIKTFTSFLTGLSIGLIIFLLNLPYFFLFGFLAFILNFIPVIGSILASIPALIVALVLSDIQTTIYLTIFYIIINISISNIIEPKIMGEGLNLSPAVIFFSLIIWGWVFGVVGTFFAVVLTMTIKLALYNSHKGRKYAIILSSKLSSF